MLAITVLGSGIAALDVTVVNIALPAIGRDFHTGIAALLWVMTSYILTLAAFLLDRRFARGPVRQAEGVPDRHRVA